MREPDLMRAIMVAMSENGCTAWRNNVGTAHQGRTIHKAGAQVTLADSRMIAFGLCVGSADIIGIRHSDGRFIAIEVKTGKGKTTTEQDRFIFHVQHCGGIAGVARSVDDAIKIVKT